MRIAFHDDCDTGAEAIRRMRDVVARRRRMYSGADTSKSIGRTVDLSPATVATIEPSEQPLETRSSPGKVVFAGSILRATSIYFSVSISAIRGTVRTKIFVQPRIIAAKIMRMNGWSLGAIGRSLGGRDHTTIIYYLEKIKRFPAEFQADIKAVEMLEREFAMNASEARRRVVLARWDSLPAKVRRRRIAMVFRMHLRGTAYIALRRGHHGLRWIAKPSRVKIYDDLRNMAYEIDWWRAPKSVQKLAEEFLR
jgi:hypothetical protein